MDNKRPELGEIKTGDPVFVRRSMNDMRGRPASDRYIPARIFKVARVWVGIEQTDEEPGVPGVQTWRMRRDTQDEGTRYIGSNASFVTPEQKAHDEQLATAQDYLREAGIGLSDTSPWRDRELDLAGIIRAGIAARESGRS